MRKAVIAFSLLSLMPLTGVGEPTIDEAIEQRQATFKSLKGEVKKFKEGMQDSAEIVAPAEQILRHAKSLIGTFVDGSHKGKTRAKKKIWKKWPDFEARQNELVTDAERLLAASRGGERKEVAVAFKKLAGDCKGCHRRYRQIL